MKVLENADPKQSFGLLLAIFGFVMTSIDMLLIPWSKEGQSYYPYRYSSVVCIKYVILLILIVSFQIIRYAISQFCPVNIFTYRHQTRVDPLELEQFDVISPEEDSDDDDLQQFVEKVPHNFGANDRFQTMIDSILVARVFAVNGFLILIMEVCMFTILEHIPAATFAIIRNLVIPFTALIRGVWFREKPTGIQWLALIGVTSAASSFAAQDASFSFTDQNISTEWFWLGAFLMLLFIALESVNIVYLEKKFSKLSAQLTFTEQQFWVTLYCVVFTLSFWIWDDWSTIMRHRSQYQSLSSLSAAIFRGYSVKTIFLISWRVIHAIVIFWMVKYLTSVVAMLVHTTASLGTSVLDWLFMDTLLSSGQWFDTLATMCLILVYKIAPYEQHVDRRFEILHVDEEDD